MPDYTEEDVERMAMQLWWLSTWGKPIDWSNPIIAQHWSECPDVFRNRDTGEIDGRDSWRSFTKIAIGVIDPLAYTATALAMKVTSPQSAPFLFPREENRNG